MKKFSSLLSLLSVLVCFSNTRAFSMGADESACGDMVPRHNPFSFQDTPSPYTITISNSSYKAHVPVKS